MNKLYKLIFSLIPVYLFLSCSSLDTKNENAALLEYENIKDIKAYNGDGTVVLTVATNAYDHYIANDDRKDKILGISIMKTESIMEDGYGDNPFHNTLIALYKDLVMRGFTPTVIVYYSNDTKSADTIVVFEGEKEILVSRFSYYLVD